jgi:hypothetical protein
MFQVASFMVWWGSDRNAVSLCTGRGGLVMCWATVARMSCDGHAIDMVLSPIAVLPDVSTLGDEQAVFVPACRSGIRPSHSQNKVRVSLHHPCASARRSTGGVDCRCSGLVTVLISDSFAIHLIA